MSRSIRAETRSRTKDDVRKIMHAVDKVKKPKSLNDLCLPYNTKNGVVGVLEPSG